MSGDEDVLARLVRLADERGGDLTNVRALIEQASEAGAERAMMRIGLSDESARDDIAELRQLLAAWRDAKRSAWKAVVDWVVRGFLAILLIGIAVKMGFGAWLK
ncbi:hypothetical protein GV829_07875 [Sphingomonas lacunae]|uniref:Uncharacterized protein n=1 Tax=Sphingomonas lacunae TaxID=2698828 RepID=A0A6M4ATE7_9SPHN|nr:DUF6127 family protein [Sphingomonas lacunae]QJQ32377.1 hypothetical protein GV829_07875 [Sphingomonas lacunae]